MEYRRLTLSLVISLLQYVPDGFTPESYKKFLDAEKKKAAAKNLGKVGPRGFKSRRYVETLGRVC
jgi:hypothetical protein